MADKFRNEVIHYFGILLVAREMVQTLAAVAGRDDRYTLFGFGIAEEVTLHKHLMAEIRVWSPSNGVFKA